VDALKCAKAEAEKGEFISHETMGEWINSLGTNDELSAPSVDVFKAPV
jgi:predicted transcriptional regulator